MVSDPGETFGPCSADWTLEKSVHNELLLLYNIVLLQHRQIKSSSAHFLPSFFVRLLPNALQLVTDYGKNKRRRVARKLTLPILFVEAAMISFVRVLADR